MLTVIVKGTHWAKPWQSPQLNTGSFCPLIIFGSTKPNYTLSHTQGYVSPWNQLSRISRSRPHHLTNVECPKSWTSNSELQKLDNYTTKTWRILIVIGLRLSGVTGLDLLLPSNIFQILKFLMVSSSPRKPPRPGLPNKWIWNVDANLRHTSEAWNATHCLPALANWPGVPDHVKSMWTLRPYQSSWTS